MNDIVSSRKFSMMEVDKKFCDSYRSSMRMHGGGFFYCFRGETVSEIDGKTYILQHGDICIYTPFSMVRISSASDDLQGVICIPEFDFIVPMAGSIPSLHDRLFVHEEPCVSLDDVQRGRVEEMLDLMRRRIAEEPFLRETEKVLYPYFMDMLARVLCCEVMRAYFANRPLNIKRKDRRDTVLENFIQSLFKNYRRERSVAFYASQQCLTPRYFSTVIREKTGRTASQWIDQIVIMEAERMLCQTSMSIKEIADSLGFSNQSFFGRYFKSVVGRSPSEFRISPSDKYRP